MSESRLRLRLFPAAESTVRDGHPWVFDGGVKSVNREGRAGELAVMYDRRDRFLAVGLYDPASPIRVRIVRTGDPVTIDRAWWVARARAARARRDGLVFGPGTDGGRWIHGENDGFPGLVADRYADTLVVKLYSAVWLPRWAEIESVLREVFAPRYLLRRWSRNLRATAEDAGLEEGFCGREGDETVVFSEHGIRFEAAVRRGQKTGFFLDQRDNRARVGELAGGREVLNLFSFSGGFSLYAARGGARRVTDVDRSAHALESARRNFALNPELAGCEHIAVRADVFDWIGRAPGSYDLVIVDPPSLAPRERDRSQALAGYRRLNRAAMRAVRPGGLLVSASCSAHVDAGEFFGVLRGESKASGRGWEECWTSGHAADHSATFREAHYLKAICLRRDPAAK